MDVAATTPTIRLNNEILMPQIGLGVFKINDNNIVEETVETAFKAGYRLIDTASVYGNEDGVGRAVAYSGIPREELFITSKVWNDDQGYDSTLRAFEDSMDRLCMDYLDLYLIHWPKPQLKKSAETWRAMERLYDEGLVRAIGVSNFKPSHLDVLLQRANIVPVVNQIELHPMFSQLETRAYCHENGIAIESWAPLMRGGELLQNKTINGIANIHGKEPAQVVLRWHIQSGLVAIPKSVKPERIQSNIDIFDFELSDDEMERINGLNRDLRLGSDPDYF